MFSHLLNVFSPSVSWHLKPLRYPKDSENNYSSKVLLPYSVLGNLVSFNYQPPYVFEICHQNNAYKTACSVLDFQLEEDEVFVPSWMYEQLCLDSCEEVTLRPVRMEQGEGIKLLPHRVDFLQVENPKKELESMLKNYHVLSYGDEILLNFEDIGRCRFTVTKIYPENQESIYIVDTDLNVDFNEPLGYKEKIESERTVMKYISVREDTKILEMGKPGIFVDWDALKTEN